MDSILSFNSLLFPLVGGYYIVTRLEFFKYINQRNDSQAIIFNSIIVGICLLIPCLGLSFTFKAFFPDQFAFLREFLPIKGNYIGTCGVSFIIAIGATRVINFFTSEKKAVIDAINRIGNELELFLKDCFLANDLVQVTLKNDKVYIGWMQTLPEPQAYPYIKLFPAYSGYRDAQKKMHLTTSYVEIYEKYIQDESIKNKEELETSIVIRVDEIISSTRFDLNFYLKISDNSPHIVSAELQPDSVEFINNSLTELGTKSE